MRIQKRKRLVTPTNECHASSIIFDDEGNRLMMWFGGTQEGLADCAIYYQLNNQRPAKFYQGVYPCWNPVLFKYGETLFVFFKEGRFCDCWQTYLQALSISDGRLKTLLPKPIILTAGLNACVKTAPVFLDNVMLCGASVETCRSWASYVEAYAFKEKKLLYLGRSNPIIPESRGIIQPALWKEDGLIHAFFRSAPDNPYIFYAHSISPEEPLIWTTPEPTGFPNPNSSIDVVKHSSGKLYLAYNPDSLERNPLVVSEIERTKNGFKETKNKVIVHEDPQVKGARTREASYPFMIEHDNLLHLSYTLCRARICSVEISC